MADDEIGVFSYTRTYDRRRQAEKRVENVSHPYVQHGISRGSEIIRFSTRPINPAEENDGTTT